MLLMFRTADLAIHALDLARGTGGDTTLDEELCASLWQRLEPVAPLLGPSGLFGTPGEPLGPGASAQDRILNATGR
jgi:hypothetical protein